MVQPLRGTSLRLSTSVLDALTGALSEGVVALDADGRIVHSNASAQRLLGLRADDLDGQLLAFLPVVVRTSRGVTLRGERLRMALRCPNESIVVVGVDRPGGETSWLSVRTRRDELTGLTVLVLSETEDPAVLDPVGPDVVVSDPDDAADPVGEPPGAYGQIDLTIVEQSHDLITRHDASGRITWASAAAADVLGRTPGDLVGDSAASFAASPEDLRALRIGLHRVLAEGRTGTMVWGALHPLLGDRSLETTAHLISGSDTQEILAFTRDVTERLAADRALAASEQRFRTTFDASPIGMALVAADGTFLRVNAATCAMTGYGPQELLRLTTRELVHPEDVDNLTEFTRQLLGGERAHAVTEVRFLRADGNVRWEQVHLTTMEGAPAGEGSDDHLRLLVQAIDITEQLEMHHKLEYFAGHDFLTGLLNRRSFEAALEDHQHRVAAFGYTGALLVLDLDHFKYVNDSLGHHAGDELIKGVAAVLSHCVGPYDIVARLGGDEFAVLVTSGQAAEAISVAESLIEAVRSTTVQLRGGSRRRVTTSVGIALFDGSTPSADEMLVAADLAMYDAKEEGRNRWALASSTDGTDQRRTRTRVSWVERIEHALEHDRFELYAQPIIDLATNEIHQYELLLRMREADGSLTLPGDFLAVAERLDLIQAIDRWVTGRAIDLLSDHQRIGDDIALEVNLSGRSLNDPGLLDLISSRLRASTVDPSRLIFEITETAAVADLSAARAFAMDLAELGCRFALDDFGAGYGSFYYLKYLPFDFLKIDGEFVSACTTNPTDQTIIRALVDVARQLGKKTVAEFTRDAATLRFLRREGVDHAQGFHIGIPQPLSEVLGQPRLPFDVLDLTRDGFGDAPLRPNSRSRRGTRIAARPPQLP